MRRTYRKLQIWFGRYKIPSVLLGVAMLLAGGVLGFRYPAPGTVLVVVGLLLSLGGLLLGFGDRGRRR